MAQQLLEGLRSWEPFRIDALGIVTLLGASEVDQAIGSLARWRFTHHFPLLAANVVAQDTIRKPVPGFVLYNISDAIIATDVAGWFCRWVQVQNFTWHSSILYMSSKPNGAAYRRNYTSILLGAVGLCPCFIIAILTRDWWALANFLSMATGILTRAVLLDQNRKAIDRAVISARDQAWARQYVKVFLTTPAGIAITIYAPRGVITEVLLTTPRPPNPGFYLMARCFAWLGFGTHIISLGMSSLINQIIAVTILIGSTILFVNRIWCDELSISSHLEIKRFDEQEGKDTRARAYQRLDLADSEEISLVTWGLFPQRTNVEWWARYRKIDLGTVNANFEKWMRSLPFPNGFHRAATSAKIL